MEEYANLIPLCLSAGLPILMIIRMARRSPKREPLSAMARVRMMQIAYPIKPPAL